MSWTRRTALGMGFAGLLVGPAAAQTVEIARDVIGNILLPWRPGWLDIHHLSTGRGDATLIIGPDGKASLVDVGAVERPDPAKTPPLPDLGKRAGQSIADYVQARLLETGQAGLTSVFITHLHPDHIGGVSAETPMDPSGRFHSTGISDLAAKVKIGKIIDPDHPTYGYPPFEDRVSAQNYVNFVSSFKADDGLVEQLKVGHSDQILPSTNARAGSFSVRAIAARGLIWTGRGTQTRMVFQSRNTLVATDYPNENASSSAALISFGPFRYFIGGDITDWADAGTRPWLNALTPLARAIGPVDVAVLPHHGMYDGSSSGTIAALSARNWIISAWHAAHPSIETLERVYNTRLYSGPRDVYITAIHSALEFTQGRLLRQLAGRDGNIIVRAEPGGKQYQIVMTDPKTDKIIVVGPVLTSKRLV
jgi:beta-lactamase superfamily II metal-dependent hydrolase